MNAATLNSVTVNSVPGGRVLGSKTYITKALLVIVQSRTYITKAILQKNQSRTYTTQALLQGGSTKFYSTAANLAIPYHDNGSFVQNIGNGLSIPVDRHRLSTWSTYSRPTGTLMLHQAGVNVQTGKVEYWDGTVWRNYDGTAA